MQMCVILLKHYLGDKYTLYTYTIYKYTQRLTTPELTVLTDIYTYVYIKNVVLQCSHNLLFLKS